MMQDIFFTASEYRSDQSFQSAQYRFTGSCDSGWEIERDGKHYLTLGPGYVAVQTRACGICSTDLVRHKLPFALPQITGHEVIGQYAGQAVAIEINASHLARGVDTADCLYCRNGLDSHCPDRLTVGIDRLPGGFSPWLLAPRYAIHPLPLEFSIMDCVMLEPFAAALHAVKSSAPLTGDRVAVLGPRRLGMLIIAALQVYRQETQSEFEIIAVMRHSKLAETARGLGADTVCLLERTDITKLRQAFDIVFDTTGSVDGFALAADMARRILHLKSTHGQQVQGLESMTSMVINEQRLRGLSSNNLQQAIDNSLDWSNQILVYVSPHIDADEHTPLFDQRYRLVSDINICHEPHNQGFEMALVSTVAEINQLTQPVTEQGLSRLRAGGSLFLSPVAAEFQAIDWLGRISLGQLELLGSRCGPFKEALEVLRNNPQMVEKLQHSLITDIKPLAELTDAFKLAAQSDKSLKVVIDTELAG